MSDDLPNSAVDYFHNNLLVDRLTDSGSTGVSNDLGKGATLDEAPKTASRRIFLQRR